MAIYWKVKIFEETRLLLHEAGVGRAGRVRSAGR